MTMSIIVKKEVAPSAVSWHKWGTQQVYNTYITIKQEGNMTTTLKKQDYSIR